MAFIFGKFKTGRIQHVRMLHNTVYKMHRRSGWPRRLSKTEVDWIIQAVIAATIRHRPKHRPSQGHQEFAFGNSREYVFRKILLRSAINFYILQFRVLISVHTVQDIMLRFIIILLINWFDWNFEKVCLATSVPIKSDLDEFIPTFSFHQSCSASAQTDDFAQNSIGHFVGY